MVIRDKDKDKNKDKDKDKDKDSRIRRKGEKEKEKDNKDIKTISGYGPLMAGSVVRFPDWEVDYSYCPLVLSVN